MRQVQDHLPPSHPTVLFNLLCRARGPFGLSRLVFAIQITKLKKTSTTNKQNRHNVVIRMKSRMVKARITCLNLVPSDRNDLSRIPNRKVEEGEAMPLSYYPGESRLTSTGTWTPFPSMKYCINLDQIDIAMVNTRTLYSEWQSWADYRMSRIA